MAACNNFTEIMTALEAAGANTSVGINAADEDGKTPLMYACENGHLEVVRAFIASGAVVHAADENYRTPLMYACANGHIEVAKTLIAAGANVNSTLMYACINTFRQWPKNARK